MKNLCGPVGDLYCFSNTFRMLVVFYVSIYTTDHLQKIFLYKIYYIFLVEAFSVTEEERNFSMSAMITAGLLSEMLRTVLENEIPADQIYNKVKNSPNRLRLSYNQMQVVQNASIMGYQQFDIPTLCHLIRNLTNVLPSSGIRQEPYPSAVLLGDDVERIRYIRNGYFAHVASTRLANKEFDALVKMVADICHRMDFHFPGILYSRSS